LSLDCHENNSTEKTPVSSLPLISHHLFVAAIDEPHENHERRVEAISREKVIEVVVSTEPLPEPAIRSAGISIEPEF
jgi:hypothetical protein